MTWHAFATTQPDPRWPILLDHPQWERPVVVIGLRADPRAASVRELRWMHTGISREMMQDNVGDAVR